MATDRRVQIQIIDPKALTVGNGFFFKQRGFYCRIKRHDQ
jgi:hypothetical protein